MANRLTVIDVWLEGELQRVHSPGQCGLPLIRQGATWSRVSKNGYNEINEVIFLIDFNIDTQPDHENTLAPKM